MDHVLFDRESITFPRDGGVAKVHRQQVRLRDFREIGGLPVRLGDGVTIRHLLDAIGRQDVLMIAATSGHAIQCGCSQRAIDAVTNLPESPARKGVDLLVDGPQTGLGCDEDEWPVDAPLTVPDGIPLAEFVRRIVGIGAALAHYSGQGELG